MSKRVRVDLEADAEIAAGIAWYERQRPGLGAEFLDAITAAIDTLQEPGPECSPVRGIPLGLGVKRKLVSRFPYMIIFMELNHSVRVIAVPHSARRPGYWRQRI